MNVFQRKGHCEHYNCQNFDPDLREELCGEDEEPESE